MELKRWCWGEAFTANPCLPLMQNVKMPTWAQVAGNAPNGPAEPSGAPSGLGACMGEMPTPSLMPLLLNPSSTPFHPQPPSLRARPFLGTADLRPTSPRT